MFLYSSKVLFTIWAKVGTQEQRNTETAVAPDTEIDEKNSSKYLHIKIIVVPLRYE